VIGQDVHECDDQETTGPCAKGFVASADGTRIGYRQLGRGPGVVLLRGGVNASQHLMRLGSVLENSYELTCPVVAGGKTTATYSPRSSQQSLSCQ
jgi:hypothetical protein